MNPSDPYPLLKRFRLAAAAASLIGLGVWAWRMEGWLFGVWVGILSVGFLPLRIASTTLAPQVLCVAALVWGGLLTLGKPWSKTGTAEQFGGGILLGGACLTAPWGFLFGASVPLHGLFSKRYRRRLERPFWLGFGLGLLPGLVWLFLAEGASSAMLGFRPETLGLPKFRHLVELATSSFGWPTVLLMVVGCFSVKGSPREDRLGAVDFAWPILPSLLLGYADPLRSSLAFPGTLLLAALGVRQIGHLFVNKTERKWLSTFLTLVVGYSAFFGSTPVLRERQAHSNEVKDLAELLAERVPSGEAVALFRLNHVAEYLSALEPERTWKIVRKSQFPSSPRTATRDFWGSPIGEGNFLWIDPKRLSESGEGLGKEYWEDFLGAYHPRNVLEKGQVELWQFASERQTR
jgi:hypothetical protein